MKRIFSLLILMASSVAFAGETGLQDSATPSETSAVGRSANDVVNTLAKRLSLTEEQKSKIFSDRPVHTSCVRQTSARQAREPDSPSGSRTVRPSMATSPSPPWCAGTEQFRRVPSSAESVQVTSAAHTSRRTHLYFLQKMRSVA
jgi:hypothetical protein